MSCVGLLKCRQIRRSIQKDKQPIAASSTHWSIARRKAYAVGTSKLGSPIDISFYNLKEKFPTEKMLIGAPAVADFVVLIRCNKTHPEALSILL